MAKFKTEILIWTAYELRRKLSYAFILTRQDLNSQKSKGDIYERTVLEV